MGLTDRRGQCNTETSSGTHSSENRSVHNRQTELELLRELMKYLSLSQSSGNATKNDTYRGHSSTHWSSPSAISFQLIRVIKACLVHLMSLTPSSTEQSDEVPADASSIPLNNLRSRQCPMESGAVPSVWMNNPQEYARFCLACLLSLHLFRIFFSPRPGVKPQLSGVATSANDPSFPHFSRSKRNNIHGDCSVQSLRNCRESPFSESNPNVFSLPSALSVDEDDGVTVIIRPIRHPKPKTHTRRSYTPNHSLNAQTIQQLQRKYSSTIPKRFSNHPHSAADHYPVRIAGAENSSEFPKQKNWNQWQSRVNSRPNFRIHI
ncbi:hypothetical protein CRM22_001642 [Opisthorchis felineus]|uniref:Uncharacterized protein n=1 Tax=Opisthorchis felineus TaxID=147828 RepID=A0A4S2ME19_OPIFE|nr:hypothetical protein CRM22_001642 [Opisthorchis felineus]